MTGRGTAAALAGVAMLAGCSSSVTDDTPAPCPRIAILADGADLTRFRAGAPRDLTAMAVDARIAGFDARCDFASRDRRTIEVRVTPRFQAERGPAAPGPVVELPWFVALSDPSDAEVLARVPGSTRLTFPPNVQRAAATGATARLTLPVPEGARAGDYTVRVSFQLTPEELALNRQRGPR